MSTVFLSDLARISGRTRDAIRNMQNRDGTPWDDADFADMPRRRYGVKHALSLILCELLEAQRITAPDAAKFVESQQSVVSKFLAQMADGEAAPRFVAAAYAGEEINGLVTWSPIFLAGYGTAEEITDLFSGELASTGREKNRVRLGEEIVSRRVGGPLVAVASVQEAFRILTVRAAKAGFAMHSDGFKRIGGTNELEKRDE